VKKHPKWNTKKKKQTHAQHSWRQQLHHQEPPTQLGGKSGKEKREQSSDHGRRSTPPSSPAGVGEPSSSADGMCYACSKTGNACNHSYWKGLSFQVVANWKEGYDNLSSRRTPSDCWVCQKRTMPRNHDYRRCSVCRAKMDNT